MNVSELVRQHTNIQSNLLPLRLGDLGWPLFILIIVIFLIKKMSRYKKKRLTYCSIRLCLVRVKYFSENKYFSEMLFFEKENIFKCLVAFQKMFWKIFSSVWLCY